MNIQAIKRISRILTIVLALTAFIGVLGVEAGAEQKELLNMNTATVKEIMKLPGIGKKKAEAIVAFRQENGGFQDLNDLRKIEGIGKKTFNKIKDHIVLK